MRRPRALTICVENPSVIPRRIQIEEIVRTVYSGGILREKVIPSEIYILLFSSLLPEFLKISVLSVHNYQCQIISER